MTAIERLRSELAMFAGCGRMTPREYAYTGWPEFLQRHGEEFACAPCPRHLYMRPGFCYGNAIMLATMAGLPYVEGFAVPREDMPAVPHAWNLDAEGRVVDSTWALGEDAGAPADRRAYLGVRFAVRRADEATWEGDSCVLDDWKRRWPVLREPWTGEDSPGDVDGLLEVFAARDNTTSDVLERAWARRALEVGRA